MPHNTNPAMTGKPESVSIITKHISPIDLKFCSEKALSAGVFVELQGPEHLQQQGLQLLVNLRRPSSA